MNEEVLARAPQLRVVANCGAGYDHIDVAACTRRGIVVTNTPDVVSDSTADMAFALLLAVARRVVEGQCHICQGLWRKWEWGLLWGTEVHHKTLGLYGFGQIGQAMARRARGFSMRVLYHARRRVAEDVERELQARVRGSRHPAAAVRLLEPSRPARAGDSSPDRRAGTRADETDGVLDQYVPRTGGGREGPGASPARRDHRRRGTGRLRKEPNLHPDLLRLPNVVLTPHIGTATAETRLKMASLAAQNLLEALHGRRPPNVVNPEVYK